MTIIAATLVGLIVLGTAAGVGGYFYWKKQQEEIQYKQVEVELDELVDDFPDLDAAVPI